MAALGCTPKFESTSFRSNEPESTIQPSARAVLYGLKAAGLTAEIRPKPEGGHQLVVRPAANLTPELRAAVAARRDAIILELQWQSVPLEAELPERRRMAAWDAAAGEWIPIHEWYWRRAKEAEARALINKTAAEVLAQLEPAIDTAAERQEALAL